MNRYVFIGAMIIIGVPWGFCYLLIDTLHGHWAAAVPLVAFFFAVRAIWKLRSQLLSLGVQFHQLGGVIDNAICIFEYMRVKNPRRYNQLKAKLLLPHEEFKARMKESCVS